MKRSPHIRLLALGVLLAFPQGPASAQLSPEKELATFQLEPPLAPPARQGWTYGSQPPQLN